MPTRGSPGVVELRLGLLGQPVDQRLDVAALELGRVDLDRAAGVAEAARVPGEHVEAGAAQRRRRRRCRSSRRTRASGFVSREPPQPWVSRIVGRALARPSGRRRDAA